MLCCMRTTIRLDERLLREVKQYAARTGTTFSATVEDALRQLLARRRERSTPRPVQLVTFRGDPPGLQPGVDLDDSARLLDVMETGR